MKKLPEKTLELAKKHDCYIGDTYYDKLLAVGIVKICPPLGMLFGKKLSIKCRGWRDAYSKLKNAIPTITEDV